MKVLKKVLSVGLSLVMCASMVAPACAASFTDLNNAIIGSYTGDAFTITNQDGGGRNITLNENVSGEEGEKITVGSGSNIVLNLNGWNVEGSYTKDWGTGMVEVESGAALTVKNTLDGEKSGTEGKILNRGNEAKEGNTVYVKGSAALTLESGTIAAEGYTSKSVLVNGGTFTMNDGTINGGRQSGLGVMDKNGQAVVNKGEIFGNNGASAQQEGTLTVNGGTIQGTGQSGVTSTQSGKLILNGGKVSARPGSTDADISIVHGANVVKISSKVDFTTLGISSNSDENGQSNTIVVDGKYQITYGKDREVIIEALDGGEVPPVLYDIAKKMVVKDGDQKETGNNYWEWIIIGPDAVQNPFDQIPETGVGYKYESATEGMNLPDNFPAADTEAQPNDEVKVNGGKWVFQGWPDTTVETLYDMDGNPVAFVNAVPMEDEDDNTVLVSAVPATDEEGNPVMVITPLFGEDGKHLDAVTFVGGWVYVPDPVPPAPTTPPVWRPDTDPYVPAESASETIKDEAVPLAGIFTRGDAIGYLWEQTGSPDVGLSGFVDVLEEHQWAVAIGWAEANGIAVGNEDNEFRPDDLVLREELEEFLNLYARFAGAVDADGTFITLDGEPDDIIFGEEAQEIFDDFFARLAQALNLAA